MIKGVNLGNWLVLEKWMSPELFGDVNDETDLCTALSDTAKEEWFKVHRGNWITDRDFAYMAAKGIELVRLPVPFFVFGGYEPYVGCIEYVDKAFDWAERHGIEILVDLHIVPESQNGFDSGMRGVCKFHKNPKHVELALEVLERLAERYRDRPGLWGIEVLNEPVSPEVWAMIDPTKKFPNSDPERAKGSEPVPTAFLEQFYRDAYARIRAQAPDVRVVFHDGFRLKELAGFFTESDFSQFAVDTHMYLGFRFLQAGDTDLEHILGFVDEEFGGTLEEMSQHFPILVGEWALDPYSPQAYALTGDERLDYYRRFAEGQLQAWEPAIGWCYWSYRLNTDVPRWDAWDLLKAIETGLMPAKLAARQTAATR